MKTAQLLFERLGIASLPDLERALETGALNEIPRLGTKSIENMRRGLLAYKGRQHRTPLGRALPLAREIVAYLAERAPAHDAAAGGQRAAARADRR